MWVYNYSNQLTHHGVLGMKWGVRKDRTNDNSALRRARGGAGQEQETPKSKARKAVEVGTSVAVGLLSSSFGAAAVFGLTGSTGIAKVLAPALGILGGTTYYNWISKR